MKNLSSLRIRTIVMFVAIVALAMVVPSCGSSKPTVSGSQATRVDKKNNRKDKKADKKKKKKPKAGPGASHALAGALLDEARSWLGTPYRYGGTTKDGADCSGFIMEVYRKAAGIAIPRNSRAQKDYCADLSRSDLEIGDLVFFSSNASGGDVAHVGMYVGDGMIIHASSSKGVIESSLDQNYYVRHYQGSGRVPEIAQLVPVPRRPETDITPVPEAPQFAMAQPQPDPAPKPKPEPVAAPVAKQAPQPKPQPEPQPEPRIEIVPEKTLAAVSTPEPEPECDDITVIEHHSSHKQAAATPAPVTATPAVAPASRPEAGVVVRNAFGAASRNAANH